MNIRINTQHRFTVSRMPFYRQRKAVSLVAKRPFTTSTLKVHIHLYTCLWVVLKSLSTRFAVKDDFGKTRRWRCLQQSQPFVASSLTTDFMLFRNQSNILIDIFQSSFKSNCTVPFNEYDLPPFPNLKESNLMVMYLSSILSVIVAEPLT